MIEVLLFCEDAFHDAFVRPFLKRVAMEAGIELECKVRTARGGLGRMASELDTFLHNVEEMKEAFPDALVIVADGNCKTVVGRRKEFADVKRVSNFGDQLVYAIPNPHIERWMMVDPQAFKEVFGKGCRPLPAVKCEKGEYKKILREEFEKADFVPPLGGREYAEKIVMAIDLDRASNNDDAFSDCLKSFRALMNRFKSRG